MSFQKEDATTASFFASDHSELAFPLECFKKTQSARLCCKPATLGPLRTLLGDPRTTSPPLHSLLWQRLPTARNSVPITVCPYPISIHYLCICWAAHTTNLILCRGGDRTTDFEHTSVSFRLVFREENNPRNKRANRNKQSRDHKQAWRTSIVALSRREKRQPLLTSPRTRCPHQEIRIDLAEA